MNAIIEPTAKTEWRSHDEAREVHACWCKARSLWMIWSECLEFWRVLKPGFMVDAVDQGSMRLAIRLAWQRMWMVNPSSHGTRHVRLPPLASDWKLVMHLPSDDLSAFRRPS